MVNADDITITSTQTSSAARKYIQPYLHKVFAWTKQNNLTLNPDKTTCTLFPQDPAEYKNNMDLKINNTTLRMATHPKVLGLTLDPKLTYRTQIHNISVQAHKPLQMIKALTATGWGKQTETLMVTYKAVMRTALEYASSIWSPLASLTSINKLQVMQNAALRTATGCTQDTNITICMTKHSYFPYTSTYSSTRHKTNKNTTSITPLTQPYNIPQHSKAKNIIFNNGRYTTNIHTDPHNNHNNKHKNKHAQHTRYTHKHECSQKIHIYIVSMHLATRGNNKILRTPPPHISNSE